jgi:ribose 5-phosphate isomerase B
MRVAIATDHAGFSLKEEVIAAVREAGHEVLDLGTWDEASVDYPDFAAAAGRALQRGEAERAIVLCGSGVGVSIAGNKLKGVYAGVCHDTYSAHQSVEHDHMNMLCLGSRVIGGELAKELVRAFLAAQPSQEERHLRRIAKIVALEGSFCAGEGEK